MTSLLPTAHLTEAEAYEDMFREITRKLYGEESAHGLYPHNTQVAQLAPGAPTAPPDVGERSFTTLTQIGYETTTVGSASESGGSQQQQQQHQQQQAAYSGNSSSSAVSTAFGLAALMQNGFPPPGAILNPVNFPGSSKTPTNISTPSSDNRWQSQQQQHHTSDDSWTGKHSSSSYSGGKSYKKEKTDAQGTAGGSPQGGLNIPSTADRTTKGRGGGSTAAAATAGSSAASPGTPQAFKRYSCTTCPYTTDRRDLFTRHENIHKDQKPFRCYACMKLFNRADHVKKHFLRMHRDMPYDIAKTRCYPASTPGGGSSSSKGSGAGGSSSSYYHAAGQSANGAGGAASTSTSQQQQQQQQQPMQLNIPSGSFTSGSHSHAHESSTGGGQQHHHLPASSSSSGGGHSGQLLQLHNLHHQQQQLQQQLHHNVQHSSAAVTIKQEKAIPSAFGSSSLNTSASSPEDKSNMKAKVKSEKKFACTFCPWAGADNWGLKRHLNTHTKPYVCLLCDYRAARSERLATHVLKVHNKKACSKCSFFAEDQAHLEEHLQKAHPHDPTKPGKHAAPSTTGNGGGSSVSNGNCGTTATHHLPVGAAPGPNGTNAAVLRNLGNAFPSNNLPTNIPTSGNGFGAGTSTNGHYSAAAGHHAAPGNVLTNSNAANLIDTINQHLVASQAAGQSGGQHQHQHQQQHWMVRSHRKRNGPDLLYSYLEADGSDSGDYARLLHMQAVGRNKASVTQDFHNAGGGDNGINGGDHSSTSSNSSSSSLTSSEAPKPRFGVVPVERLQREIPAVASAAQAESGSSGSKPLPAQAKASDAMAFSLASLFGDGQLSLLQLLATAAVAQQQLQLQQSAQSGLPKSSQPAATKPLKAEAVPLNATGGAPHGDRYGSMVSSPPATSTPHQHQQHSRPAATVPPPMMITSTKIGSNSTKGTTRILPTAAAAASTTLTAVASSPTPAHAAETAAIKRRRVYAPSAHSSSDKENFLHLSGLATAPSQSAATSVDTNTLIANLGASLGTSLGIALVSGGGIVNGGAHVGGGGGSKIGHHNLHHHHNNNNSSASINKNINDIFDKVYKKPQNSFASPPKQQQQQFTGLSGVPSSILRTAPPSAIEEDSRLRQVGGTVESSEGQQFSLTEFIRNHVELSISTVDTAAAAAAAAVSAAAAGLLKKERVEPPKRKSEAGERNPRKQQQPRRAIDDVEENESPLKLTCKGVVKVEPSAEDEPRAGQEEREVEEGAISQNDMSSGANEASFSGSADESGESRLADIRDKHMTQLVSRRLCCRLCQNQGRLDHLDNHHYHGKISLLLHKRWRHGEAMVAGGGGFNPGTRFRCRPCGFQFFQRYKLVLHQRLTKHTGCTVEVDGKRKRTCLRKGCIKKKPTSVAAAAVSNGKRSNGKENQTNNGIESAQVVRGKAANKKGAAGKRKQRKRKPRSRCFTQRRRK